MHDMMFIHCMLVNSDVCGYLVWQVPPCTVQNLLLRGMPAHVPKHKGSLEDPVAYAILNHKALV